MYITFTYTFIYLLTAAIAVVNLAAFLYIGSDKRRSMEPQHDGVRNRIKEVNFFIWAIFSGSLGVLVGMFFFHHKTQKFTFVFGISILLLQQLILAYLLINKFI